MECRDLMKIFENTDNVNDRGENIQLKELIESKLMKLDSFVIRCKVDQYTMSSENEENRVRYYLSKYLPYSV